MNGLCVLMFVTAFVSLSSSHFSSCNVRIYIHLGALTDGHITTQTRRVSRLTNTELRERLLKEKVKAMRQSSSGVQTTKPE